MAVRLASQKDLPRVVAWLLQQPTSTGTRWALEAAGTDDDARRILLEWVVHTTFDLGIIVVDDQGQAVGGSPSPLPSRTWGRLARGGVPRMPSKTIGRWQYPAELANEVHERLFRLAQAIELVTPPQVVMRTSFGLDVDGGVSEELWGGWRDQVAPTATLATTINRDGGTDLAALGFVRAAQRQVRSEPTLIVTSWLFE